MGQSNGSAPDQAQALIGSRASKAYGDRCVTLPGLAFIGRRPVDAASLAQRSSEYRYPAAILLERQDAVRKRGPASPMTAMCWRFIITYPVTSETGPQSAVGL